MTILIVRDSRSLGTCRSCGARVEWATNAITHARMPFNPPIILERALDLETAIARVDLEHTASHFATCPDAKTWRRRKR